MIAHRWVTVDGGRGTPRLCGSCQSASDCRICHCGNEVHVVEDYAVGGECHCGKTSHG